jgi:hypothetical protein
MATTTPGKGRPERGFEKQKKARFTLFRNVQVATRGVPFGSKTGRIMEDKYVRSEKRRDKERSARENARKPYRVRARGPWETKTLALAMSLSVRQHMPGKAGRVRHLYLESHF